MRRATMPRRRPSTKATCRRSTRRYLKSSQARPTATPCTATSTAKSAWTRFCGTRRLSSAGQPLACRKPMAGSGWGRAASICSIASWAAALRRALSSPPYPQRRPSLLSPTRRRKPNGCLLWPLASASWRSSLWSIPRPVPAKPGCSAITTVTPRWFHCRPANGVSCPWREHSASTCGTALARCCYSTSPVANRSPHCQVPRRRRPSPATWRWQSPPMPLAGRARLSRSRSPT